MKMFAPCRVENTPNCQPFPWHPSVVCVDRLFGGHRFWMAQTPLPPFEIQPYIDRYELPCVHYSDDGMEWKAIPSNPIEDLTNGQIEEHDYFSDPHLVLKEGVLECYYRLTLLKDRRIIGNKTLLCKKISTDGFKWSERIVVADLRETEDFEIWGDQIISPALIWEGGKYKCWYVDASTYVRGRHVRISESLDGVTWSPNRICTLNGGNNDPWHIDVQCYEGRHYMIVYDYYKLSLFVSEDGGSRFEYVNDILQPSNNAYDFYSDGLYRACSIKTENGFRVYFSARRKAKTYIGCLRTVDWKNFNGLNGQSFVRFMKKDILADMSRKEMLSPIKRKIKKALGMVK